MVTLETDIKQSKPFVSPYEKATVNLIYTHNWLKGEMDKHFSAFNITGKQYNIMRILHGAKKPVSTAYIRKRLLDRLSDVSRIVDRMEQKNLINKTNSTIDKRLVDIQLSNKGQKLLSEVNGNMQKVEKLFKNLNKKEIQLLNELLDKVRN